MPSRKRHAEIKPWLSARPDCKEGRFIQVGNSLLLSKEFSRLSQGARCTYLCMCMESGGRRAFIFPKSAAKKYGIPHRTLLRHVEELVGKGFLEKTLSGKCTREPNRFQFSFRWRALPPAEPFPLPHCPPGAPYKGEPLLSPPPASGC